MENLETPSPKVAEASRVVDQIWLPGNRMCSECSSLGGGVSSSQAACGADGSSPRTSSPHRSCPLYGRHLERGAGDGQPQPGVLAPRLQVPPHPPSTALLQPSWLLSPPVSVCPRRVTEFISCLEHTHFSDASVQPPALTTLPQQHQQGSAVEPGLELGGECWTETPELGSSQPLTPPPSVQELLGDGGRGGRSRAELKSSSLMSGSSAAKAVCVLSTQADRCVCVRACDVSARCLILYSVVQ